MTEAEFQRALKEALEERYADIPDPDDLEYDYNFSPRFERRMKRMIRNFDRIRSKARKEAARAEAGQQHSHRRGYADPGGNVQYVTFGRHTMRRAVAIALAAALILALAACAIRFAIIWHETNNEKQGTLDVTFELENPNTEDLFTFKEPVVPDSYTREVTFRDGDIQDIEYTDEKNGKTILYHQTGISESMGLSIGNEDESFTQIEINGFKGYAETEGETPFIVWSDGISLYTISSNISFDELFVIAESIQ